MESDNNKIIYDWLSFTSKIHSPGDIIELLGMKSVKWTTIKGAHGYQDRLYYDNVSIHYNGRDDMGVWCELSGQGCRNFETFGHGSYEFIFKEIHYNKKDMNITRLDIAYDDFDGVLDLDVLINDTKLQNYISTFKDWAINITSKGSSITFGSMKSDVFIRIYDKARERGFEDGRHWVRCEIQLRRDRAVAFAFLDGDIGTKYFGVLNNYLRFVTPDENDSNKRRWATAPYWQAFIDSVARISIYEKPGSEYNELNLENFVFKQAGNSIYTYIECFGEDEFFNQLKKRGTNLNPKQQMLLNKYKEVKNEIKASN